MPTTAHSPREQLIRIQQSLARRLHDEIIGSFGAPSADLLAYQREYARSFRRGFRRIVGEAELLSQLAAADLLFQGEYHTLAACQGAGLRILEGLRRRRSLVLCLEAAPIEGQPALDAYLAREIDEESFLEAIDYPATWGFAWRSHGPVFRFAREHEAQVYALGTPSLQGDEDIRARDERAAEVITRASASHPGSLVYVIAGDFRVCRRHLPRQVGARLREEGISRRSVIVHQNVDDFYWRLALERKERRPAILDLGGGEYCVLSSTPLVKYQSYLHWELGLEELDCGEPGASGPGRAGQSVTEAVRGLVRTLARFLRVDPGRLDDFTVYTTRDLDFIADLERSGSYSAEEIVEVERQILNDESYFLSRGNIIYLSSLSVDHAAEEAAHYINNKLSGHVPCPLPARADFYSRAMREALGFLGSKIVNPSRRLHREEDFREIVDLASRRRVAGETRPLVALSRLVLRHLEEERDAAAAGRLRSRLRSIHAQELDLHLGITHSLGYILGEKLYRGLASGRIERSFVRRLFHMPFSRGEEAEAVYFDLVSKLR